MNGYDRVLEIMSEALETVAAEGISKQDMLPAVIDFVTALALIVGKEPAARAVITRMEGRIRDWKAGTFPATDAVSP
jgi:hypothetical protein